MLHPGDEFGPYVVRALLGQGGMGSVYRARDTRLKRDVALKLVSAGAEDAAQRLLREARAAAALDHPNVVQVFDIGEIAGQPYIAMELVRGRSLGELVGATEPDRATRVRWLRDVARALAAAHAAGLIHRDIKPENVMVRNDGSIKVLDFGIARRGDASAGDEPTADVLDTSSVDLLERATAEGAIPGTPMYMSPEQVLGLELDARSDQFSWGVLAYEVLTGAPPWPAGGDLRALVTAIVRQAVDEVPGAGSEGRVVVRALSKDPDERYEDMGAVLAELEAAIPATTGSQPPAAPPRRIGAYVLGGVAVVAVAIAVYLSLGSRAPAPAPAPAAPAEEPAASKEGASAYAAALQALQDGQSVEAMRLLEKALEHDPSLAAAHVRLADMYISSSRDKARQHFSLARQLRGGLAPRDQEILASLEPLVLPDEPDWTEAARRLKRARELHPRDAEIAMFYAMRVVDDLEAAVAAFDEVLAIEPSYARAYWLKAQRLAYLRRTEEARAALAKCIETSPTAVVCLHDRAWLDQEAGRCEDMRQGAQRIVNLESSADGWAKLAVALFALGRPPEAVADALAQANQRIEPNTREVASEMGVARLAVLRGDFGTAEAASRRALDASFDAHLSHDQWRSAPITLLVQLLLETGRAREAAEVADNYLRRSAAWADQVGIEDFAIARDPTALLLHAKNAGGMLSAREYSEALAHAVGDWERRAVPSVRSYVWIFTYAAWTDEDDDAGAALAALPRFEPLPTFRPLSLAEAMIGPVLYRGGRDARASLEAAARACNALEHPVLHTRALYWLGRAREDAKDRAGACEAYRSVRSRWGEASVTAKRSAVRARGLGCT